MNNIETVQSGLKWLAFALAIHFFCSIFSGFIPILGVLVGLVGVWKLRKASPKSNLLVVASLILLIYYAFLFGRELHLWFVEKHGLMELLVGNSIKLFFLYAILTVLKELAYYEVDQLLVDERKGTIFFLFFVYITAQSFVLNVDFMTAVYIFIGCILLSTILLSMLIHLIVKIGNNDKINLAYVSNQRKK